MLTRNFYNWWYCIFSSKSYPGVALMKNWQGTLLYPKLEYGMLSPGYFRINSLASYPDESCIMLGTGTSIPTIDDYTLEAPLSTNKIACDFTKKVLSKYPETPSIEYTIYVTNITSATSVQISEIGLYVKVYGVPPTNYSNNQYHACLIERSLLPNPLTIEPSQSGIIKYVLKNTSHFPEVDS